MDKKTKQTILRRMDTIPLQSSRPSITRSDTLCGALRRQGINEDTLAEDLAAMRQATVTRVFWEKNADGVWEQQIQHTEDWRTRLEAAKLQTVIEGWGYSPQKAQDQNPLVVVINQLAEQAQVAPETITNRLIDSLKTHWKPTSNEGDN